MSNIKISQESNTCNFYKNIISIWLYFNCNPIKNYDAFNYSERNNASVMIYFSINHEIKQPKFISFGEAKKIILKIFLTMINILLSCRD